MSQIDEKIIIGIGQLIRHERLASTPTYDLGRKVVEAVCDALCRAGYTIVPPISAKVE